MESKVNDVEVKLKLNKLTKMYNKTDGVEDIDLTVNKGELLTLLGPSGCGKTTILRAIGGFIKADRGEIILDGKDISNMPPEKRPTSMVFQSYNLWPHMTVYENLSFGLRLKKEKKEVIKEKTNKVLDLVRMTGSEGKFPSQLSGGQQQRVAIARALIMNPSLLLLDEPFSALDAKIRQQMREELKKIQKEMGITIVFVTHDQEEAMTISDRIVVMNKGVIEQIGSPEEIYDKPSSVFVASFIGTMNFLKEENSYKAARPENTRIVEKGLGDIEGEVLNTVILGHYVEVLVSTKEGNFKSYIQRDDLEKLIRQKEVGLKLEHYHLFPEDKVKESILLSSKA